MVTIRHQGLQSLLFAPGVERRMPSPRERCAQYQSVECKCCNEGSTGDRGLQGGKLHFYFVAIMTYTIDRSAEYRTEIPSEDTASEKNVR